MKPKPWGCTHYGVIALMCFALLCYVAWECLFKSVPLRISPETTYITEPLDASGKWVDYFKAMELKLYPAEMKTDENGARIIVRALGIGEEWKRWEDVELRHAEIYYEKLGLDLTVPPTHYFLEPYEYFKLAKTHKQDVYEAQKQKMYDRCVADKEKTEYAVWEPDAYTHFQFSTPWTIEDNPLMEHWLHDCSSALDIIAEAAAKPAFMFPLVRLRDDTKPWMNLGVRLENTTRRYIRGLQTRANYRIAQGDFDGAFDDIIACYRLDRRLEYRVNHFGIASGGRHVYWIDFNFPGDKQPTAGQLRRLLHEIENLPPRVKFEMICEMERLYLLTETQTLMLSLKDPDIRNEEFFLFDHYFSPVVRVLSVLGVNWNTTFQHLNQLFDEFESGTLDMNRVFPDSDQYPQRLLTLNSRSEQVAKYCAAYVIPSMERERTIRLQTECADNLKRLTLATLIYEKEHGTLPDSHPLHSWRVLLLPYLGEQELYEKIRLDEPWDSEHNRQFHEISLSAFQCPSANHQKMVEGGTHYSVIVRDNPEFGSDKRNMLLIVERQEAICWMKPDEEITQRAAEAGINKSPTALGSHHLGGLNAATKAGGVRFISDTINDDKLREWIVGTDNEIQ